MQFMHLAQVFMLSWSYLVAVVTEPGRVPSGWSPFATSEVGIHATTNTPAP